MDIKMDKIRLDNYTEADLKAAKQARSDQLTLRANVVRQNKSRRLRGKPTEPLPDKPAEIYVPVQYSKTGEWEGRLYSTDDLEPGSVLKWEKAQ
jgi:hypothetical protein